MNTQLLSVIAPCLNEEGNVGPLTERIIAALTPVIPFEIIFVDDGSSDRTFERLNEIKRSSPAKIVLAQHQVTQGIEAGWKTGLTASSGDLICLIDSDLQNQPEDIPKLIDLLLRQNADMAQGSRAPPFDTDRSRLLLSRVLNFILNTSFRMRLVDNKSGFAVMKRVVLRDALSHKGEYRYFQCLLAVAAHTLGYRIVEIPTLFCRRTSGVSFMGKFPFRVVVGCLQDVVTGFSSIG